MPRPGDEVTEVLAMNWAKAPAKALYKLRGPPL